MIYTIKITGSGTKKNIVTALRELADSIKESQIETEPTGKLNFEDATLIATISEED